LGKKNIYTLCPGEGVPTNIVTLTFLTAVKYYRNIYDSSLYALVVSS